MTVAEKIKALRKQAGFTQTELGDRLGVKKNAVSKWECGRVEDIPASKLKAMASLFHVSASYLIDDNAEHFLASAPQQEHPIINGAFPMPVLRQIPLLGSIACGMPILANDNIEDSVDLPEHIHANFALRCKGDSMINARIFDGDIVYIRQQDTVDSGSIAAVLIGDEATLKRVQIFEDRIVLEPENPMYRPLIFWGEEMNSIRILGKAVAFTGTLV